MFENIHKVFNMSEILCNSQGLSVYFKMLFFITAYFSLIYKCNAFYMTVDNAEHGNNKNGYLSAFIYFLLYRPMHSKKYFQVDSNIINYNL